MQDLEPSGEKALEVNNMSFRNQNKTSNTTTSLVHEYPLNPAVSGKEYDRLQWTHTVWFRIALFMNSWGWGIQFQDFPNQTSHLKALSANHTQEQPTNKDTKHECFHIQNTSYYGSSVIGRYNKNVN